MSMQNHERRQFGRRTIRTYAWVEMATRPRVSCIVMNVSETGALLELLDAVPLTIQFRLVVDHLPGCAYCEVRHQYERRVGIMFIRELSPQYSRNRSGMADADRWR